MAFRQEKGILHGFPKIMKYRIIILKKSIKLFLMKFEMEHEFL